MNDGNGLKAVNGGFEPGWIASDDCNLAPTDANLAHGSDPVEACTWTPFSSPNENLPSDCVDWYEAYAFCIWDGARRPVRAERISLRP